MKKIKEVEKKITNYNSAIFAFRRLRNKGSCERKFIMSASVRVSLTTMNDKRIKHFRQVYEQEIAVKAMRGF